MCSATFSAARPSSRVGRLMASSGDYRSDFSLTSGGEGDCENGNLNRLPIVDRSGLMFPSRRGAYTATARCPSFCAIQVP